MLAPVRWGRALCFASDGQASPSLIAHWTRSRAVRLASFGNDRSPSLVDYQKSTANVRIISLATLKMTPSRLPKGPIRLSQIAIVLLLSISSVLMPVSMNWGDIVDEPERNESAVSNKGETISIAGIAARLSSDTDSYRVPSQDWGTLLFSRKPIQQTISRQSRNGGNGHTHQVSETRKKEREMQGK